MNSTEHPAVAGPVEPTVRPRAWEYVDRKGWVQALFAAEPHDLYPCKPLYDQAALAAARTKALQDAARWVDEELGHALQDGYGVEAVQALMGARDMLKAHADLMATTISVPGA